MSSRHRALLRLCALSLLLVTLLGPSTQIPVTRADWQLTDSGNIQRDISGLSGHYRSWSGLTTDNKLRFVWSTGSIGVDFYIMDQDNFNLFSSGYSFYCAVIRESLISDNFEWQITRNGEVWYTVWSNDGLLSTHLSGDWYLYNWIPNPWSLYMPWILLCVGIAVICVIIAIVVEVVKRSAQGPKEPPSPQTRMCPKCNALLLV